MKESEFGKGLNDIYTFLLKSSGRQKAYFCEEIVKIASMCFCPMCDYHRSAKEIADRNSKGAALNKPKFKHDPCLAVCKLAKDGKHRWSDRRCLICSGVY